MARRRHTPFDVAVATAETLAHRLPVFWKGVLSPSPAGNAAITEMIVEKQVAFTQGMMAMQAEMVKHAFRPWWMWTAKQSQDAASDLAHAATAPASRKVKANARRLRKK
jgi:hypothetical protein